MISSEYLYNLIFLFFLYSFLGWVMEVLLKYIQFHRFINRGFLLGPYCPIYGSGVVLVTVLNDLLAPIESSYGTSFLIAFVFCGLLEYLTSYFLEKKYQARWWDYSQKPMNLHGRVWIGNLILFGIGGLVVTRFINPLVLDLFGRLSQTATYIILGVLVIAFIADYIFSGFIMRVLKQGVESSEADQSEAIALEIRGLLQDKNLLYSRIIDAYPEIEFRTEKVRERLERIKENREYIHLLAEEKLDDISEQLKKGKEVASKNLVSTKTLQKNIIENQTKLIDLLLMGDVREVDKESLLKEIKEDKEILDKRNLIK